MKTCSKCLMAKPRSEYNKHSQKKDGLRPDCNGCRRSFRQAQYAADPTPHKLRAAAFRQANPGYNNEAMRVWYEKNTELAFQRALAWGRKNRPKRAEIANRRRAHKMKATPAWANLSKILEFYETAEGVRMLTGEWYHVDHIVPLGGRNVCGLHNEFNLQILTATENIRKGNRYA